MCNFWTVMPKDGNFENRPVSQNPLPVEQNYAQFRPPGVQRVYICATGGTFSNRSFIPKFNNFENRRASRKTLPVEQ